MSGSTATTTRTRKRAAASPRTPASDPRIEARRREVARDEGRKRLRVVVALAGITLLSIGVMVALQSRWLDIEEIVVSGTDNTSPDQVRSATGIEIGAPLVDLDLEASAAAVRNLPWVATAEVDRAWNGTVSVSVTERTPALALPAPDGSFMLVDAGGRQLGTVAERPAWSHVINGLEVDGTPGQPAPTEVHGVLRLLGLLSADQMMGISSISVVDTSLVLDLVQGGVVDLGNDSGLADKLVSYDTLRASVDLRCLHRIDLRVHTAPAITRISATGEIGRALSDMTNCT